MARRPALQYFNCGLAISLAIAVIGLQRERPRFGLRADEVKARHGPVRPGVPLGNQPPLPPILRTLCACTSMARHFPWLRSCV